VGLLAHGVAAAAVEGNEWRSDLAEEIFACSACDLGAGQGLMGESAEDEGMLFEFRGIRPLLDAQ